MKEREIKLNGKNLFYRLSGEGPAVLLLHGFGEDGTVWEELCQSIEGFQFIVPDLPGTGSSAMVDEMSMEGLAAVMNDLTHELKIESFVLVGHSMGGYIALAFAAQYPERLTGLGLFHSTAYADTEEKKATRRKGIEFVRKNGAFEFLNTTIPNLYAPATKENDPSMIEEHINASKSSSDETLIQYYESMIQRPDRTEVLRNSKVPVLFIVGRHDTAVPLKDVLEQCYLPALSHVHILEASGHMGMKEETQKSVEAIHAFLGAAI